MTCEQAQFIVTEFQATAPGLMALFGIAAAALLWQWWDDYRRDRVCAKCGKCQQQINGVGPLPPPSSGVKG